MPKPPRKVLIPDPRYLGDWKQTDAQPIPNDKLTLQLIVKALLHRIRRSNPREAKLVRMAIREFTSLENSPLQRDSKEFEYLRFSYLSILLEDAPKSSHRLRTLQVQKSLLIDRLELFEESERNDMALWLQQEEGKIIQDLTAFPCYCNYATSLQEILAPHRSTLNRKDSKPLCNTYHGMKLVHVILGTLHHLSPTRIETLLKMPIAKEKHQLDFDRLQKFMKETP